MATDILRFAEDTGYFTRLFGDHPHIIDEKRQNLWRVADIFHERFGDRTSGNKPILVSVPNRVELLGKHTDYQGGTTFLLTGPKNFFAIVVPADDGVSELINADSALGRTTLRIDGYIPEVLEIGVGGSYTKKVVERLSRNLESADLPPLRDVKAVFIGDVPFGGGTSGSSSKVIADFFIFTAASGLLKCGDFRNTILENGIKAGIRFNQTEVDDFTLALSMYIAHYENGLDFGDLTGDRGVGTFGGSEDHTAILLGEKNRLLLCRYCPTEVLQKPDTFSGYSIVVAYSGKAAQKTKEAMKKYNNLSDLAGRAVEALNRIHCTRFPLLRDFYAELDQENRAQAAREDVLRHTGNSELADRVFQFYTEETLIKKAVFPVVNGGQNVSTETDTVSGGESYTHAHKGTEGVTDKKGRGTTNAGIRDFGTLITESHELSRKYLKNIEPEIDQLVHLALDLGAAGATGFGAGFGGSCYALVPEGGPTGSGEEFARKWERCYLDRRSEYRGKAQFDLYPACSGACVETVNSP
jgi:galactokinase